MSNLDLAEDLMQAVDDIVSNEAHKAKVDMIEANLSLVSFLLRGIVLRWLWGRLAKGVFHGMVAQNLLPSSISLRQAFALIWLGTLLTQDQSEQIRKATEALVVEMEKTE